MTVRASAYDRLLATISTLGASPTGGDGEALARPGFTPSSSGAPDAARTPPQLADFLAGTDSKPTDVVVVTALLSRFAEHKEIDAIRRAYTAHYRLTDKQITYIASCFQSGFAPYTLAAAPALGARHRDNIYRLAARVQLRLSLDAERGYRIVPEATHSWRHPEEIAAYDRITSFPGIEKIIASFADMKIGKTQEIHSRTQRIRVSSTQLPEIFEVWDECLVRGQPPARPGLFIGGTGMESFSYIADEPHVVLTGMLASVLSPQEMLFVMAREIGRIRMGLVPHSMLAMSSDTIANTISSFTAGLGTLITHGLRAVLMDWYRKLDLSLDRFAYQLCRNEDAVFGAMMKMCGAPVKYYGSLSWAEFVAQGQAFFDEASAHDKAMGKLMNIAGIHQWPTARAAALDKWLKGGEKRSQEIPIAKLPEESANIGTVLRCRCGMEYLPGDAFCTQCGARMAPALSNVPT